MTFDWGIALGATGVAIGLPALWMAIPPFCQLIWGRPKLKIEFVDFTGDDGKDLMCSVFNEPVTNKFLQLVGVRRDAGDLNASFDIVEDGSGKLLFRAITAVIHDATTRESALVVRARPHFHAGFSIILCRQQKTWVPDPRREQLIEIAPGNYRARVLIVCDDQPYVRERAMQLDAIPTRTAWV